MSGSAPAHVHFDLSSPFNFPLPRVAANFPRESTIPLPPPQAALKVFFLAASRESAARGIPCAEKLERQQNQEKGSEE
ncbi:hypothetical protein P5W99_36540 [Paraburkholderia sp. A3BS-1L]|uniref:hypothetical protein n=1 Tax=Paraburkholderia sp. A3BS-1L TaxID=3028375 RepID=UPI003DA98752